MRHGQTAANRRTAAFSGSSRALRAGRALSASRRALTTARVGMEVCTLPYLFSSTGTCVAILHTTRRTREKAAHKKRNRPSLPSQPVDPSVLLFRRTTDRGSCSNSFISPCPPHRRLRRFDDLHKTGHLCFTCAHFIYYTVYFARYLTWYDHSISRRWIDRASIASPHSCRSESRRVKNP